MTAFTADRVVVQLEARINKYMADTSRAERDFQRKMDNIGRAAQRAENKVERSALKMGASLRAIAGALAGGVAIRQVQQLADRYTRLENSLTAAGVAAKDRAEVEDRLFNAAARNGTQAEALAQLYRRTALSGEALGASQAQLLQLTDGVAAALRVEGIAAQEARGPLLQLGQALASPVVRAEELNSVLEGVPEIARAAARGLGVTVAELRQLVLAGDLSNTELFSGLLRGLDETERRAQEVSLTIGNSVTVLVDQLSRYIGQTDNSLSATERLSAGILALANNLDRVAGLAAAAATVFGARMGGQLAAGLAREIAATRESIRAHNDRIRAVRNSTEASIKNARVTVEQARATRGAAIERVKEVRTTQAQVAASLRVAQAQKAQALGYVELQRGLVQVGAGTGQLTSAKNQLAIASRNVLRLQRLERQLDAEAAAAKQAHTAAVNAQAAAAARATAVGARYNRVLEATTLRHRAAAFSATVATRAMAGLRAVASGTMALLGGPFGVALAVVAGGVALLAHRSGEAARRAEGMQQVYRILGEEVDEFGEATGRAADAQARLNREMAASEQRNLEKILRSEEDALRRLRREAELLQRSLDTGTDIPSQTIASAGSGVARQIQLSAEAAEDYQNRLRELDGEIGAQIDRVEAAEAAIELVAQAQDTANESASRAIDLASIQRRASDGLSDALEIVAGAMGDASAAQSELNAMQKADAIATVTAALARQQAALVDLEAAITATTAAANGGIPFAPDAELPSADGAGDLEVARAAYQRRIDLFNEFLDALREGRAEVDGASDAAREREDRLRREARAIEDSITREREFATALEDTRNALRGGEVGAYAEQVERLRQEQEDAATALAVLRAQYEAGTKTEAEFNAEAAALSATLEQLGRQMGELRDIAGLAEGAKAAQEEREAVERLNAAYEDQLQYQLNLARLRGDEQEIRRLERRLYIEERIAELMGEQGQGRGEAVQQATQEAEEIDSARRYGEARDLFARSFSDGLRAALSGDLKNFLSNSFGTIADEAFQRLGEKLFDAVIGAPADVAKASAEGAAQGAAASAPIGTAITTASATGAATMAQAITTAGIAAGQAMAASIAGANAASKAGGVLKGIAGAITGKSLPGRATGGPVAAGRAYMVGEKGPEPFVPNASGTIIPNGALKALSDNRPAKVGPITIKLEAVEGEMFDLRVRDIAGPMATQASVTAINQSRADLAKIRKSNARSLG